MGGTGGGFLSLQPHPESLAKLPGDGEELFFWPLAVGPCPSQPPRYDQLAWPGWGQAISTSLTGCSPLHWGSWQEVAALAQGLCALVPSQRHGGKQNPKL